MPEKGKIITFTGPDTFLLREHVHQYFSAATQKYGEYNVLKIDPAQNSVEDLKNQLCTAPFFSMGKRIIFLQEFPLSSVLRENAESAAKTALISEILASLTEDMVIICISENPDRRTKAWKDLQKLSDPIISHEFKALIPGELTPWVQQRTLQNGGKILPGAAEFLWQYCGTNLWNLAQEIEKLVAFNGEKPISEHDIRAHATASVEMQDFALSNAFASGKSAEVLQVFHELLQSGESAFSILFRDFGSGIRNFLLVRASLDSGAQSTSTKIHPFIFQKLKSVAGRIPLRHLQKMQALLTEIDAGTKNGTIPTAAGKEDLLIFALENWVRRFFAPLNAAG